MKLHLQVSARRPSSDRKSCVAALLAAAVVAALAVPAAAQMQFAELRTQGAPARMPSGGFSVVANGDVDGDGDLDLVVAIRTPLLYLNDSTGTFTDATSTHMPSVGGSNINSLVLGDVDGDGDLDLIVGNGGNGGNVGAPDGDCFPLGGNKYFPQPDGLYLNDGTGTFTDATSTHLPWFSGTTSLALGDVDGDGDLDLLLGNDGQSRLYLNSGTGTFTDATASHMPVGNYVTTSMALGDVDGDGDLDLVLGNDGQSRLCLNSGTGTFADMTATQMPIGTYRTASLALGDVDVDGDLDLVVRNGNDLPGQQSLLYLNDGVGAFTDVTSTQMPVVTGSAGSMSPGDVDGDGDLDLVSSVSLYVNDGTGTFADVTTTRTPAGFSSVALADVDGDGDLDTIGTIPYLNLLRQLDAPSMLSIGGSYQLDVYSRFGPLRLVDVAIPYVSTATAHIPLPPLGTIGIDPSAAVAQLPLIVPQASGVGSLSIPVPNNSALAGVTVYTQALLIQYPLQARLTNVISDVIQR